jgi:hypothetical protein
VTLGRQLALTHSTILLAGSRPRLTPRAFALTPAAETRQQTSNQTGATASVAVAGRLSRHSRQAPQDQHTHNENTE